MVQPLRVEILTTAHWSGDPRLNRHAAYLRENGHEVIVRSFAGVRRWSALASVLQAIARSRAAIVILPDPETYFLGGLLAKILGKRAVIDIHEDYEKVARARPWIPRWARPLVASAAGVGVKLGRLVSWRVMVAGPEFAKNGDYLVLNLTDPATLDSKPPDGLHRVVYVGDITEARGSAVMVDLIAALDDRFTLRLVGPVEPGVKSTMIRAAEDAGTLNRIEFCGRREHAEAWALAAGSLVGLSLLLDFPAYREAVATKLWEYMAVGVPPLVSNLPGQRRLVSQIDPSLVIDGVEEAAATIEALAGDPERRTRLGEVGRHLLEETWREARPDRVVQSVVEP